MQALNINQYGNVVNFEGRTTLELEENETGSYIPKLFLKQVPPPQKNLHLPVSDLRKIEYNGLNSLDAINQLEADIKDHVETKIQLFFYQLVLVSGLGLKFFQDKAYYQAGVNTTKEPSQANLHSDFKAVEAHCPTLVTILAADRAAYESCFVSDDNPIERVFLGDGTFYGRSWNMTVTLPSCVNTLDSSFEWQHKDKKYAGKTFRQCCVKILNNVSKGKLTPAKGLMLYLVKGTHYLISVKQDGEVIDYKARINDIYLEVFRKYHELLSGEKAVRMIKALTFSLLTEGEANVQLTHHFMIGKLQEEIGIQRNLLGIGQRIQVVLNTAANSYKELRLLTKGVALERTSSDISRWLEEYIAANNH